MKNPHISWLTVIAVLFIAFTLGVFVGRNFSGKEMTLSIPDEIKFPPPVAESVSNKITEDSVEVLFPIDINTASVFELTTLPGIGDGLAEQIVDYRENHGKFSHVEELMNVPGIGENRMEGMLGLIIAGG